MKKSILLVGFFLIAALLLVTAREAQAGGEICYCHFTGSGAHTICTSNKALQNAHRVNHGDSPFGCECGDGVCQAGLGETCGTCPQDCGVCVSCGDGDIDAGEECGDGSLSCAGVTGCGTDGSDCACVGCRCALACISDGVCNAGEDCNNCSADCSPCDVCGNGALESGEQCDDGNASNGDCCGSNCQFESAGSPCFDGNACTSPDACDGGGICESEPTIDCADCVDADDDGICDEEEGFLGIAAGRNCHLSPVDGTTSGFSEVILSLLTAIIVLVGLRFVRKKRAAGAL